MKVWLQDVCDLLSEYHRVLPPMGERNQVVQAHVERVYWELHRHKRMKRVDVEEVVRYISGDAQQLFCLLPFLYRGLVALSYMVEEDLLDQALQELRAYI